MDDDARRGGRHDARMNQRMAMSVALLYLVLTAMRGLAEWSPRESAGYTVREAALEAYFEQVGRELAVEAEGPRAMMEPLDGDS